MIRSFTLALVVPIATACLLTGCGDSAPVAPVSRSEEAIKADTKGQDAMRAFMQTKGASNKKSRKHN